MITVLSKLFENFFSDPKITPARFLNFCMFVNDAMEEANTEGQYDADLLKVKAAIKAVEKEINDVDTNLNSQVTNTSEVNEVMYSFGKFMQDNSGAIAYALGGNATSAYYEFYPYKSREYIRASKLTMPKLVARVETLSNKYADKLGVNLSKDLAAFQPAYKDALSVQRKQITTVNGDRK